MATWQQRDCALPALHSRERHSDHRCLVTISPRQLALSCTSLSSPGLRTRAGTELQDTVAALPVTGDKLARSDSGRGSRSSLLLPPDTRGSAGTQELRNSLGSALSQSNSRELSKAPSAGLRPGLIRMEKHGWAGWKQQPFHVCDGAEPINAFP